MSKRYHYMFILKPSDAVINYIGSSKRYTETLIGNFDSRYSIAHLTIWDKPNTEQHLMDAYIASIQANIGNMQSVVFLIDGFNSFNNDGLKTIFASIKPLYESDKWFNDLYHILNKTKREPHITVSKTLNEVQYNLLWDIFKDIEYKESFIPECLTILALDPSDTHPIWKEYKKLPFKAGTCSHKLSLLTL